MRSVRTCSRGDTGAVGAPGPDLVIDLNADVGEVESPELLETGLLEIVTSANIATGAHAGNVEVMKAAVTYAATHGVALGAHPSYRDREGFGRRELQVAASDLRADLLLQVGALASIADAHALRLRHVKPHGALYHQVSADESCARTVEDVVAQLEGTALVVPSGSPLLGYPWVRVRLISEAFCDRGYRSDGTLVSRGEPGDLLTDPEQAAEQAVSIATQGRVVATDDTWVEVRADSLCMHGDTPGAPAIGVAVRSALEHAGVRVAAPVW
jgi:UPF0271 protein